MSEPTVLRTTRLDTAGNHRGLVQVIAGGQVIHSKLLDGRPDSRAAQKDADTYQPPWDEILADVPTSSTTSAEIRRPQQVPETPADPKEATAVRVKAAFAAHDEAEEVLQVARREREAACFGASEAGFTYAQIADMVGTSHQTISQLARREKERREEAADGTSG